MGTTNSYTEILTTKVILCESGEFGRWLGHEGGAFMNAIYTLIKKTPESSLYSLPWEDSEKTTVHEPASRPPSDPKSAGTLTLDFQPLELWEGNFCCLYPPGGSDVKESSCNAGDLGSILGQEDSMKKEMATHPQYSCLENPMDRRAWQATVHGVKVLDTTEWLILSLSYSTQPIVFLI